MPIAAPISPFGLLEALVSREVVRGLSNATATWWPGGQGVGVAVPGLRAIFDNEAQDGMSGMVNDLNPVASVLATEFPGVARRDALQILRDGEPLPGRVFVVEKAQPDGTGTVLLQLSESTP
jgi:hypothetical protein